MKKVGSINLNPLVRPACAPRNVVWWSTVLLAWGVCLALPVQAQEGSGTGIAAPAPQEICELPGIARNAFSYVLPPASASKSEKVVTATFSVTYVDDPNPWPAEAMTAFSYATGVWSNAITSPVTINVEARWQDLGDCSGNSFLLGSAGSQFIWRDFPGAIEANTFYVDALADALRGSDLNPGGFDILSRYNSRCEPGDANRWYFGIDGNTPAGRIDFVSVVLHELGHGLGFSGSGLVDDGAGAAECDGVAGNGCISGNGFPIIYDRSTEDGAGTAMLNFTNPSAALGTALEGGSGGVFFNGLLASAQNGGPVRLFAPSPFQRGSSYSHLDEATYNPTSHALMTPSLSFAEANHTLGGITCAMFEDMGWTVEAGCESVLPVELTAFDAIADRDDVLLYWNTASETNNAGFEVQHRYFDSDFEPVEFVIGYGTTTEAQEYALRLAALEPGRHVFRLKQIDYDGTFEYSPEVEVAIDLPGSFALSEAFPNPFNPETQVTLMVARTQHARLDVYDVTGRRIATLHDGLLEADQLHRFRFEADGVASGLYLLRVAGEQFTATRTLTLLK